MSSDRSADRTAGGYPVETSYRTLVEHAPVCIHEIDLGGRLMSMNPAGLSLMGCRTFGEVEGVHYLDAVWEGDRARVGALLERALAGEKVDFEFRPELPGAERTFASCFVPIRDEHERVTRLMGITEEVTLRRQTEATQTQVAEQLRRIVEKAIDIVAVIDVDGRIRFQSAGVVDALGFRPEELEGRSIEEVLHPDDLGRAWESLEEFLAGTPPSIERRSYRLRTRDGTWREFEAAARDLRDDPLIRGVLLTGRDMTDQRLAEAQLLQAQKMEAVGRLTGGVAHDFNNLLAVALGNLELARDASGDAAALEEAIQGATEAIDRGAQLTQQLLAFSRKQTLEPRRVDLQRHIENMTTLLRRTLGENIGITTRLSKDLWPVRVDPAQLENALLNLAINARDAMPEGGRLEITAENLPAEGTGPGGTGAGEDHVRLRVRDDGAGMDERVKAEAFDPFFTTKPVGEGSGLGLSMVYGFVRQSGGHASIESAPGRGTTLSLDLPRSREDGTSEVAVGEVQRQPARGQRVLLVEDDPAVRTVLESHLRHAGFEVESAGDAQGALALFERLPRVDVLVSDVGLPGESGASLARRLRRLRPGLPSLLITGYQGAVEDQWDREASRVLFKPFRREELLQALQHLLEAS